MTTSPTETGPHGGPGQAHDMPLEQLRFNGQLPSPKGVALAIMEICGRDDATIGEVTRVVQTDPALTSRLLQLANTAAANGSGRPFVSVAEAVVRLGMTTVRQLAVGFSMVDQYQGGPCEAFDYAHFWSHALLMAVACQALASRSRIGSPDELFACGLMARIGCLALATVHPVEYGRLLEECEDDSQLIALERERLQTDHNAFTAVILADSGIPGASPSPSVITRRPTRQVLPKARGPTSWSSSSTTPGASPTWAWPPRTNAASSSPSSSCWAAGSAWMAPRSASSSTASWPTGASGANC